MVSKHEYPNAADHAERQAIHQVVELGAAGEYHGPDLTDHLADDRHQDRNEQERADLRRCAETALVGLGAERRRTAEVGPQDREADREHPGQCERQAGHRDRFVLPEVHVVEVDDVDDRNGERRDENRDRHRTEDRGHHSDHQRDREGDSVRLWTLTGTARHDR